jgi:O-acetyl-ADP-ribose deacetylase (regulator of RNase III)
MQEQKSLEETGQAKITLGYKLPAKYVLHTVGPIAP